jgi:hypothetical protein
MLMIFTRTFANYIEVQVAIVAEFFGEIRIIINSFLYYVWTL